MQKITITGNVGKDATLASTQAGKQVLSFNVGSQQGYGDRASTNWFRCSLWGDRGEKIAQYILKGVKVTVSGDFETSEYEDKTQLNIRVSDVEFMSRADNRGSAAQNGADASGGYGDDLEDSVPFMSAFGGW